MERFLKDELGLARTDLKEKESELKALNANRKSKKDVSNDYAQIAELEAEVKVLRKRIGVLKKRIDEEIMAQTALDMAAAKLKDAKAALDALEDKKSDALLRGYSDKKMEKAFGDRTKTCKAAVKKCTDQVAKCEAAVEALSAPATGTLYELIADFQSCRRDLQYSAFGKCYL
jgi:chromosome segregation ATPase